VVLLVRGHGDQLETFWVKRSDAVSYMPGFRAFVGGTVNVEDAELPIGRSQGGALVHVYEELQQHRGQMEITRDVLLAASTRPG